MNRFTRITRGLLTGLGCLGLGLGVAWGQGSSSSDSLETKGRSLRIVVESSVDHDDWHVRLTDADIDARELAYEELLTRARWDPQLSLALQSWSLDPSSPELAWTARMALREIEQTSRGMRLGWMGSDPQQAPVERKTETSRSPADLLRRIDVSPLLSLSERVQPFSAERPLSIYQPRAFRMPKLEQRLYKFEVQPEGVVLTEFVMRNGQTHQRRYAAESSKALLEAHPQLRQRVPGLSGIVAKPFGPGSQFEWGRDQQLLRFGDVAVERELTQQRSAGDFSNPLAMLAQARVLGVKVTPVDDDQVAARMLGPGVGLLVERREPGSLAEELGLQRGDILIELAGQPLCAPEEISRLMQDQHEEIVLKILDRWRIERVLTWSSKRPE